MPRDKLSDELSDWITAIDSYLAQYKESYEVQEQLVDIRRAIAKLRDFLMIEQEGLNDGLKTEHDGRRSYTINRTASGRN